MRYRYFVPEVLQTSDADGGPAAFKALYGGLGLYLSYSRLRDAYRTDDGCSSIESLAQLASSLGLEMNDAVLPPDLVPIEAFACCPAIVAVETSNGGSQTVVLWRSHGRWLQVMDPGSGRMFPARREFLDSLVTVGRPVSAEAWERLSAGAAFSAELERRMQALGAPAESWPDRAHQDASLRLGIALLEARRLKPGAEGREFLAQCAAHPEQIPRRFWALRRGADGSLTLAGTHVLSARPPSARPSAARPNALLEACSEPPPAVWATVAGALRQLGWGIPAAVAVALAVAACGTVIEALLFRGLFDMGRHMQSTSGRVGLVAAIMIFLVMLLAIDWGAMSGSYRIGRRIEWHMRTRFLWKLPRLNDRYFQSRLISDMAYRAHWLQLLRQIPTIAGDCIHYVTSVLVTGLAIALIYPGSWFLASLAVIAACAAPALFLPAMNERDMRYREVSAVLGSSYLDSLMGTAATRAHCAESTLRSVHAVQLRRWVRAALRRQVLIVRADVVQMTLTLGFVAALIYQQADRTRSPAGLLLLIYWATSIPQLGQEVAKLLRSVPSMRNTILRFVELIDSPEDDSVVAAIGSAANAPPPQEQEVAPSGVGIDFENVTVVDDGQVLLENLNLHVAPGEHVGVVGVSGAGKSSFLGCLLGWHPAALGTIRVDGRELDAQGLARLRSETAWIDPQVHLFRTTLFDNLCYGNGRQGAARIALTMTSTELDRILKYSPRGLQSPIGEGGTLISGGEGQRIRAARAFGRTGVRMAILDEPLRGLSRADRRALLARSRRHFAKATLFCVTHDVSDTVELDQILVIEHGRVIEMGPPRVLLANPASRYNALIAEEHEVSRDMWSDPTWRRLHMHAGAVREELAAGSPRKEEA